MGGNGSLWVFEEVYEKQCSSDHWRLWTTTSPHLITGFSTEDASYVDILMSPDCACYDYHIQIYRVGQTVPDSASATGFPYFIFNHFEDAPGQNPATAVIANAWWSDRQDADADECWAGSANGIAQLHWDPNVVETGSLTVYEKIYSAGCGTSGWGLLATTSPHLTTGQGSGDAQSLGIAFSNGCDCRDYRIDIFRQGLASPDHSLTRPADPDLGGTFEELLVEDAVEAFIANAWWRNHEDPDRNGCWEGTSGNAARLFWDTDVSNDGSLTVFEKVYYRTCDEGALVQINTPVPRVITGQGSADAWYLDLAMHDNCACYEYRIEVYRVGQSVPDYTRDWSNDSDLDNHYEERVALPEDRAVITSAGWGDEQDLDWDQCLTGTLNGMAGLYWIPDVVGSGSLSVFEKLYRKECSSGAWMFWMDTSPHGINPGGQNPAQFRAVPMHPNCACYDYRIEIYRVGQGAADNHWDLNGHMEELVAQDNPNHPLCDFDSNGRIDLADYQALRQCVGGANAMPHPNPPITASECLNVFDADGDGDVDLGDVAYFQTWFQGQGGSANLLRNPGFEDVPGPLTGSGILPSEWVVIAGIPSTFSIDGSYGLLPGDYGIFPGVLPHDGIRFVAGWSGVPECFGQQLSAPLVPQQRYRLTGRLHQAVYAGFAHPGAYEVLLATGQSQESGIVVGRFADTTGPFWEERSMEFMAPADANLRPWIIFRAVPFTAGAFAYPGLDAVNLAATAD